MITGTQPTEGAVDQLLQPAIVVKLSRDGQPGAFEKSFFSAVVCAYQADEVPEPEALVGHCKTPGILNSTATEVTFTWHYLYFKKAGRFYLQITVDEVTTGGFIRKAVGCTTSIKIT